MRLLRGGAIAALVAVAAIGSWTAGSQPPGPSSASSGLASVACASSGWCAAVGSQTDRSDHETPLAESWAGGSWALGGALSPSRGADSALEAVACRSDTSCAGVGRRESPSAFLGAGTAGGLPLAESWDGRGWTIHPIEGPPGAADSALHGVSCPSTTCVAVGDGETLSGRELTFAETWDGTRWKLDITPNPGFADDSFLDAVACPSPTWCIAVGHDDYQVQQINQRHGTLIESWDGKSWRIVPSPNPSASQDTELNGVACSSPARCVAVGFQRLANGAFAPLAESWDGHAWTVVATPGVAGSPDTELDAVSCPTPDRCLAVGFSRGGSAATAIAMSFEAGAWTIQRVPGLAGAADSSFNGIDCDAASSCLAVGTYREPSLLQRAFAMAWDGATWTASPLPRNTGSP